MSKKRKTGAERIGLPASWTVGLSLVAKYGPLSMVGLALIYWVVVRQGAQFDQMSSEIRALQASTSALVNHFQEDRDQMWVLIAVNQRTCLNTAKSDSDRMNCVITTRGKQ